MSNQATAKGERNDLGGKSGRNNRPGQSSTPAQQTRQAPPSPSADKSLPPTSPINGSPIAPQNPPRGGRPVNGAGPAHGSSVPAVAVPPARTHSAPPNLTMPPHQPIYFPEKGPVPPPMAAYGKQYPFFPHSGAFPPGMPYFMPGPMPHMPQFAQPGPSTGVPPMGPPPVSRPGPQQPQSPLAPPVSSSPTAPSPAMKMPQSPAAALAPSAPSPSAPASPSVLTPPAIVGIQPAAFQRPPVYQPPTASPTPPVAKKVSRAIQIIDPTTGQALVLGGAKPAAPASPAAPVVAPAVPTPTPVPAVAPAPVPVPAPAHPHPHSVHKSSAIVIQQPTAEMLAAHLSHQHHHGHAPASPAAPAGRSSTSGAAPAEAAPKAADAKPAAPPKEEKAPATPTPAPAPAPAPAVAVPAPAKEESKPAPVAAAVDASAAPKEAKAEQPAKEAEKSAPTPAPAKEDKAAPAPAPTPATATPVSTPATTAPAAPAATAATPASTPAPKEEKAPAAAPTAAVESEKEREEAKARSRKEILKQADRGDYKARTFDAYADAKPEAAPAPAAAKPAVPEPTRPKDAARATPPPAAERKSPAPSGAGAAEEEDSWEAKDVNTLVKSIPKPDVSASRLGKIMYDRDFLLRFQTVCTEQPPNFPPFASIIGDAPSRADRGPSDRDRGGRGGGGGEDKWERGKPVAPSRGGGRGGPPPGLGAGRGGSSRGGDRGGREVPQRRPILKKGAKAPPVLEKVAPLVASSNRWVRPSNKEADTNTLTLRKSQGLLNKLTLENFDSVSEQIISHITSLDLLSGIITQVFDKALSEPHFCPMYAQLCLKISTKSLGDLGAKAEAPTTPDGKADPAAQPKKGSQFTRLLLTRCQDEFEKSSKPEELPANLSAPEREELETKHRRRVLGNIKFIGELFKLGMLTEKIMHDCITRLLGNVKNPVPEDIEALSKLMTTIGERIDHPKAAKYMDAYFARITELSQNKKLPSRLRFMLKDLIELRAHKWVARRKVEGPKAHTTQSSERDEEDAPPPRAAPAFGGGRGGGRSVTIAPRGSLDKDFRSSDRDRDRDRDHGGFRGGRTPAPAPARTPAAAPTRSANANAFSLLGREQEERYTSGGKRDLSELSLGPGGQAHATVGASGAKGWAKPEAAHKATAKTAAAAAPAAAAPAAVAPAAAVEARPAEKEAVAPVAVSAADLAAREADRERLEGEVVSILEEYLSSKEEGEAVECIKELSAPWFHADLVCQLIVAAFERKDDADRDSTRRLLAKLHEAKVLTADDIEQGMGKVAEVLPDIALDSPRCVEFFAAFVADALHERCITAAVFRLLTTEELVGNGTAKAFLGEALLALTDLCDSPERELPALVPNLDFCVFFKPKERTATQLMSWLKEKELLTVFPFAPAARLVEEHFNKSGATNAADLETWLQDAVDAEAFEEQPEGALNLVRHVTKQVLAHAFPALDAAASAANDATRAAPYASLLKKLAGVHPQGGVALLGAVRDFASRANAPAAVASAALRVLVTSKVLPPGSLKRWAAEEKDKALVAQLSAEPWWDAR